MLLKETKDTVIEAREIVKESKKIVTQTTKILEETTEITETAKRAMTSIENITYELKDQIIKPIRTIGGILSSISGFAEGLRGK